MARSLCDRINLSHMYDKNHAEVGYHEAHSLETDYHEGPPMNVFNFMLVIGSPFTIIITG